MRCDWVTSRAGVGPLSHAVSGLAPLLLVLGSSVSCQCEGLQSSCVGGLFVLPADGRGLHSSFFWWLLPVAVQVASSVTFEMGGWKPSGMGPSFYGVCWGPHLVVLDGSSFSSCVKEVFLARRLREN